MHSLVKLWLILLASPVIVKPQDDGVMVLNATADGLIISGSFFEGMNSGRSTLLSVGSAGTIEFRSLIRFDDLPRSGKLESARLVLCIRDEVLREPVPCTQTSSVSGVGSLHVLTTAWNEGFENLGNATEGESSWLHNRFPETWMSQGGDFDSQAIGEQSPELPNNETAVYVLDIEGLQPLIDRTVPNNGFIILNSLNPGLNFYESKECRVSSNRTQCPRQLVPQLLLTFSGPSESPSNAPSSSPSAQPSIRDPSELISTCANFQQELTLTSRLSIAELSSASRTFESEVAAISSDYIAFERVVTQVSVSSIGQRDLVGSDGIVVATFPYTICYEAPVRIASAAIVDTFPEEYMVYMSRQSNRLDLEQRLRDSGIPQLQSGGLAAPVLVVDDPTPAPVGDGTNSGPNIGVIVGAAVGGVVVFVGIVGLILFLQFRRRRARSKHQGATRSSDERNQNDTSTDSPRHLHQAFPDGGDEVSRIHTVEAERISSNNGVTPVAKPILSQEINIGGLHDDEVDFKMQGRTVTAERTVRESIPFPAQDRRFQQQEEDLDGSVTSMDV